VNLKVSDVACDSSVSSRATVLQQKTGSPVRFEITKGTREAVAALIKLGALHTVYSFSEHAAGKLIAAQRKNKQGEE